MPYQAYGRTTQTAAIIGISAATTNYSLDTAAHIVDFTTASCNGANFLQAGSAATADYANATSSRITINEPGLYRVYLQGSTYGLPTAVSLVMSIYKNGAALSPTLDCTMLSTLASFVGGDTFHVERILQLEAGDYIQAYAGCSTSHNTTYLTDCELGVVAV